ncbi:hypothetical protein B7760_03751 [Burkholderia glumae]|nr:hypothetical protein B7760_03751 [Burkholderia glumae]
MIWPLAHAPSGETNTGARGRPARPGRAGRVAAAVWSQNLCRIAARTENWLDEADGPSVPIR